jgi:hypothetical protein
MNMRGMSQLSVVVLLATVVTAAYGADGAAPSTPAAPSAAPKAGTIHLDETVISGNQELPKVLYIVPWQDPSGMPTIEISPEFSETQVFRHLYPPAYRRELQYYDLLEGKKTEE